MLATLVMAFLFSAPVAAGPIDRACNASPRQQKSPTLCACIQSAADDALTWREQRKAARFFRNPHRAQEVRQSDNPANEKFWKRYKAFGALAERNCR
jgi:hypothetical protein